MPNVVHGVGLLSLTFPIYYVHLDQTDGISYNSPKSILLIKITVFSIFHFPILLLTLIHIMRISVTQLRNQNVSGRYNIFFLGQWAKNYFCLMHLEHERLQQY